MTRMLITTVLLCVGVIFTTKGMHESSIIMSVIGGFCLGIYNGMLHNRGTEERA